MIPYLLSFGFLSFNALNNRKISLFTYILILVIFTILIGLRFEIGPDWVLYSKMMERAKDLNLSEIFFEVEPGFAFFNWIGAQLDAIYLVNSLSALIFLTGLISYAKKQTYPWLSLTIAFPILIVMVGMGLTRQSIALGIEFFSLVAMDERKYIKSLIILLAASLFHISSIFLFVLYAPQVLKNIFRPKLIIVLVPIFSIFIVLFLDNIEYVINAYFDVYIINKHNLNFSYNLSSVILKILPTVFASVILIFNKFKFFALSNKENVHLYERMAYLVLILFSYLILRPQNTIFIDRFAIYLYPLTIYVFNKTIDFKFFNISRFDYHLIYISGAFLYTTIWLFFAYHRYDFVPYKNFLFL